MACGICGQPMHPGLRCVDALLHRLRVQDEEIARLRAEAQARPASVPVERPNVPTGGFDRRAYQREYMRSYRRRKHAEDATTSG